MAICYLTKQLNSRKKSYYKIGVSSVKSHKERVRHLQTGNPHKLVTIKIHKLQSKHLAEKLEQYILRKLGSSNIKRCQGEWVFGDSKKIELTFDNCYDEFSKLSENQVQKLKLWQFGRKHGTVIIAQKNSLKVRQDRANKWREEIKLTENIKSAIKQLKKPTLQKIAEILNNKGLETIRGKQWNKAHLSLQLKTMGFQKWQDLV